MQGFRRPEVDLKVGVFSEHVGILGAFGTIVTIVNYMLLVGGLVAMNFLFSHINIGLHSSSQLTKSYFSEGWPWPTKQMWSETALSSREDPKLLDWSWSLAIGSTNGVSMMGLFPFHFGRSASLAHLPANHVGESCWTHNLSIVEKMLDKISYFMVHHVGQ